MPLRRFVLAAVAALTLPAAASAEEGFSTANVNLRTGPGLDYEVVATVPHDSSIFVEGCLEDFSWCDIEWNNYRGWISADYMAFYNAGQRYDGYDYRPHYRGPVVTFEFGARIPRHNGYYGDNRGRGPWWDRY